MILVDTNVLSEFMRPEPAQDVVAWVAEQTEMAVSAVTVGELRRGALALPDGRRRETLLAQIEIGLRDHVGRILAYTGATARVHAQLHARRRSMGTPLAVEDGMIAATAVIHGAAVATRNVTDFADLGIEVIDPWSL